MGAIKFSLQSIRKFFNLPKGLFYRTENYVEYEGNVKTLGVLIFLGFVAIILYTPTFPIDDGLRHAVAWKYDFDYKKLYGEQYPFHFDPWIGIEKFHGWLHSLGIDKYLAIQIVQAITVVSYLLAVFLLLRINWPLALFGLGAIAYIAFPRLLDARPDAISSALFLLILAIYTSTLPVWKKRVLVALISLLLTLLYHFAWIYILPFILFDFSFFLFLAVASVFWWIWYSNGEWISFASGLFRLDELREGIRVMENSYSYVIVSALLAIILMFFRESLKNVPLRYWFLAVWFVLPNQARYLYLVYTLATIFILWDIDKKKMVPNPLVWIVLLVMGVYLMVSLRNPPPRPIHLPPGQKVVCDNMDIMFKLVFASDNKIAKITPPMEIGYAERWYLRFIKKSMENSEIDICKYLQNRGYTILAERSLYRNYECLTFQKPYGAWRLWGIKNGH